MPPIKPEPIDDLPDIGSGTVYFPPDIKSDTRDHTPEIPPAKRLKTLNSISPWPSSKGKSKIEKEEDDDEDSLSEQQLDTCGVCLSEEGTSLRGFIDSCEHYFCFVCIMEWAKVESRCPICKRRFSTIRRPPKDGIFLSERVVNVPVRDQVYCYNGNATLGPSDPYSQVKCSICSLATDDNLLLLCDLCDSAAHSYCVGLGATVPDGDWFCQDCTLSRDEHAKSETDANICSSRSITLQFTKSNVSINDIVRESSIHEHHTSSVTACFSQNESSSTQPTVGRTSDARTLQRCLNVHARIKVLRENWDGFRGGSLNFSSNHGNGLKAGQQQSSSLNQELNSQKGLHGNVSLDRSSYNVDKAWKMMDIASKALGKKISIDKNSKHHVKKERLMSNGECFGGLKKRQSVGTSKTDQHIDGTVKRFQNRVECELPSPRKIIVSTQVNNCRYNDQNQSQKDVLGATNGSPCLIRSPSMDTEKHFAKRKIEEKVGMKKVDSESKKLEDAKSEIQSLVKLNLKLVSRDKKLEVDVFKEVARHATHSILGACGIERPKPEFRSFPRLVCNHNELQKRPRSTLMPTSCRECFFVFVKEVVNTIAFDRTGSGGSKT